MKKNIFIFILISSMTMLNAVTVDFNNLGVVSNISINGFAGTFNGFDVSISHGHFQSNIASPSRPDNGTTGLLVDSSGGMTIVANNGSTFSLNQFDAAEWDKSFSGNQPISVTGTLLGGGTVVQNFTSDSIPTDGSGGLDDYETYFLNSNFTNLVSININSSNNRMMWDNIVLNETATSPPVPEPSSMVLLSLVMIFTFLKTKKLNK